jgi:hypothetical protein
VCDPTYSTIEIPDIDRRSINGRRVDMITRTQKTVRGYRCVAFECEENVAIQSVETTDGPRVRLLSGHENRRLMLMRHVYCFFKETQSNVVDSELNEMKEPQRETYLRSTTVTIRLVDGVAVAECRVFQRGRSTEDHCCVESADRNCGSFIQYRTNQSSHESHDR